MFSLTRNIRFSYDRRAAIWAPAALLLILTLMLVYLGYTIEDNETDRINEATKITAQQVQLRLEAWIDDRIAIVEHYADHHSSGHKHEGDSYILEADQLLHLYDGFQALNFIDTNWIITDVFPAEQNKAALGKDLHSHPASGVCEAISKAEAIGQIVRTPLVELLQGGKGFATYVPITQEGRTIGFINGVFKVGHLVDGCLSEANLRENYALALYGGDGELAYSHQWQEGLDNAAGTFSVPIRVVDKDLELRISPSPADLLANRTHAVEVMIGIGLAMSLLLVLVLRILMIRHVDLEESREKYRILVENQADMVLKMDLQGVILFASPTFCAWMKLSEAEVVGQRIWEYVPKDEHDLILQSVRNVQSPPNRDQFEIRAASEAGYKWTSWTISAICDDSGVVEGYIGVGRDVTRRIDLEEQLRHSQKLQAVGQLAGGIAHDFNNIIQAIQGYLGFVKSDLPRDSRLFDDVNEACRAADRAVTLTRQLLAFSRRQVLNPINLDLNLVITETQSMLRTLMGESVELKIEPGADLAVVKADQGQIEQVLVNLCVNARDAFGDSGGTVVISTENRRLEAKDCAENPSLRPGAYVKLRLADNGSGMSEDVRRQIFDPFFTTKTTGMGTGLGLATAYGIAKQHGGFIDVESRLGVGTVMSVYLPISAGEIAEIPVVKSTENTSGHETILLVEDEDMVRNVALRILVKAGYEVIEASDGTQALEIYMQRQKDIDLVFMDVVMPGLSGREVSRHILAENPDARILLASGYDAEFFAKDSSDLPKQILLPKPYSRNTLLGSIRDLLDCETVIFK